MHPGNISDITFVHDNWVLAHHGFVPKTSAIFLLGYLLVVCATEDCPHKVEGCCNQLHLSWLEIFHIAGHSRWLFSTKMLHATGECLKNIIHQGLMNGSMACLSFFSCFSGPVFHTPIMRLRNHNQ